MVLGTINSKDMLTFRRIIITIIGLLFNIPAIVLFASAIIKNDYASNDTWAMLFIATLLAIVGVILWWVAYDMGKNKRRSDTDPNAIVMAHLQNMDDNLDE